MAFAIAASAATPISFPDMSQAAILVGNELENQVTRVLWTLIRSEGHLVELTNLVWKQFVVAKIMVRHNQNAWSGGRTEAWME